MVAGTEANGRHLPGIAKGWAVVARFGRSGVRSRRGASLKVVAINIQRGTGSTTSARLNLLRRVISAVPPDGATVYFTPAGFFGCASPCGDAKDALRWPGVPEMPTLPSLLGTEMQRLPLNTLLAVGVEPKGGAKEEQEQWWFRGGSRDRVGALKRCADAGDMTSRTFSIADFTVLGFVCGELWDGGSGLDVSRHTKGVDLVLDLAHASVNRFWDRSARPFPRSAFQRAFKDLGDRCGAMLSHAHDVDVEPVPRYVRRQDNWIVYKGEDPFPDENSYEVHRLM